MIRWFEKHAKISWAITFIGAVGIFYISSMQFEPSYESGKSLLPLIYHFSAFFLFGFFLMISLVKGTEKKLLFVGVIMSVLYAISDEIHQFFVPGRAMSLGDIFVDSTGVLFALMSYSVFLVSRRVN